MTLALILLLTTLARPEGTAAPAVTLALKPAVAVSGIWVTVRDVAEVSGVEPSRIEEIRAMRLGRTPMPGVERVLGTDDVAGRLRQLGVTEAVAFSGSVTGIRVSAAVRTIRGDELVKFGRAALERRIKWPADAVTIEDPVSARTVIVPDGNVEMRADIGTRRLAGLVNVGVEVWEDGKRLAKVPLSFHVTIRVSVPYLARAVESGNVIGEGDLEERDRELSLLPEDAILDRNEILGLRATRPLASGNFVRRIEVAAPIVLKRGAEVILLARIGTVEARASATAREDGTAGQVISVMNVVSKRTVKARVLGADTVEAVMP